MKFNLTRLHHPMEASSLSRLGPLVCMLSLLLWPTATMAGSIKCWTNKDGVRECGAVVPPEYSQQRVEVMNERGIVVDVKEAAKTKEQLAEEARLAKLKQEELRQLPALMSMNLNLYERTEQQIQQTEERIRSLEDRISETQAELSLTEPYEEVRTEQGTVVLTGA
ncbi:MAG: hypothetical protein ACWGOW_01080, partial [Gammaproteobacteria bacterium]